MIRMQRHAEVCTIAHRLRQPLRGSAVVAPRVVVRRTGKALLDRARNFVKRSFAAVDRLADIDDRAIDADDVDEGLRFIDTGRAMIFSNCILISSSQVMRSKRSRFLF
jgi:hypothetical protein